MCWNDQVLQQWPTAELKSLIFVGGMGVAIVATSTVKCLLASFLQLYSLPNYMETAAFGDPFGW